MKKYLSLFLIALMFCAVVSVGCGGRSSDSTDSEQTESLTDNTGGDTDDYDPNEEGRGTSGPTIDLSTITEAYTVHNGETLTGTLSADVKISIADGAAIILRDANIDRSKFDKIDWTTWTS